MALVAVPADPEQECPVCGDRQALHVSWLFPDGSGHLRQLCAHCVWDVPRVELPWRADVRRGAA